MKGFIYKITNDINDKVYIGQTTKTLKARYERHLQDSRHYKETTIRPLYRAINKYGEQHFQIELVEECDTDVLSERERYWIQKYNSFENGYNATMGGEGSQLFNYDFILYLINEKKTLAEIESIVGCGKDTIYNVANLYNVTVYNKSNRSTKKITRQVEQLDRQGNVLRCFDNPREAMCWCYKNGYSSNSDFTQGATHIRSTCNGKRKSAYGFIWRYK